MLSWFEASAKLNAGDRVRFVEQWDIFSENVIVRTGMTGTVTENSLNEMQPALLIMPDDESIRSKLKEWDGNIWLIAPDDNAIDDDGKPIADSMWQEACPVEVIAEEQGQ